MNFDFLTNSALPVLVVLCALAAFAGTGVVALVVGRRRYANAAVYGLALAISVVCGAVALRQLCLGGHVAPSATTLPVGLPWVVAHFKMDLLSAFFLLIVNGVAAVAGLYGMQYGHHEKEPMRVLPFYPLFILGMNLVVVADDAFVFLVAWEIMSLASWALVVSAHKEQSTLRAGYLYLVMAGIGTFALMGAFGLMASGTGFYTFEAMRAHALSSVLAAVVVGLALFGAGAKAGLVPLHAWLPQAHPAAPSHISALMSGVMTKVALYGLIRILFDLVGSPQIWWGGVVMMIGGVTAVTGILYALMQNDLKRLLAYSTVENVGIIVIGLGLSLAFWASGLPVLAGLALAAALFHALNHALFKSLLFFGAGAVLTATGTRDMEKQGGLIHRMPVTAVVFLIGAMSISALPPFNGFVSEWLTFQAILGGVALPQWLMKFALPVVGVMLALAAAFTAVCMVKVYGVVFLGRARTEAAAKAKEVGLLMLAAMGILAALCTLIGVLPSGVLALVRPVVTSLLPKTALPFPNTSALMLRPMEIDGSSYSGLIVLIAIVGMTAAVILFIHRFASKAMRRSDIWDCGFPNVQTNTQYTASSFRQPLRRIFGTVAFSAKESVKMPEPGDLSAARFNVSVRDHLWEFLYAPVVHWVNVLGDRLNATQSLSIRSYLSLMFGVLVALLIIVAVMQ